LTALSPFLKQRYPTNPAAAKIGRAKETIRIALKVCESLSLFHGTTMADFVDVALVGGAAKRWSQALSC